MKESQTRISEPVYALIGGVVVAFFILLIIAIVRPIIKKSTDARIAKQEEEVARVKTFLLENLAEDSESVIQLTGFLQDGKKKYQIITQLELSQDGYDKLILNGSYRYASQPKDNTIELTGWCNLISGEMELLSGEGTEKFELVLNETDDALEGQWYKYKSKRDRDKKPENYEQKMGCSLAKK